MKHYPRYIFFVFSCLVFFGLFFVKTSEAAVWICDACKLNVSLGVPFFVDPALGKNYGLSFCPDGISF